MDKDVRFSLGISLGVAVGPGLGAEQSQQGITVPKGMWEIWGLSVGAIIMQALPVLSGGGRGQGPRCPDAQVGPCKRDFASRTFSCPSPHFPRAKASFPLKGGV